MTDLTAYTRANASILQPQTYRSSLVILNAVDLSADVLLAILKDGLQVLPGRIYSIRLSLLLPSRQLSSPM